MKYIVATTFLFLFILNPLFLFTQQALPKIEDRVTALQDRVDQINKKLNQFNEAVVNKESKKAKVQNIKDQIEQLQIAIANILKTLEELNQEISSSKIEGSGEKTGITTSLEKIATKLDRLESSTEKIRKQLQQSSKVEEVMGKSEAVLNQEIKEGTVHVSEIDNDSVKIKIANDILFQTGEISLSGKGQETIKKLSLILKEFKNKNIYIIGHTDKVPISKDFQRFFPTNWELSVARGVMVTRYLVEEMGISPSNITAGGKSFYQPLSDSDNAQNRRTEIWIFPDIEESNLNIDHSNENQKTVIENDDEE